MPRVSIGLPVYNGERYIAEAIESILEQTFNDFELIICDNASTDHTEDICRDFMLQDSRVKYYRNTHNIGSPPNFNHTFQLSSGEYFKWAAHDDLCAPQFLARCLEVLERDDDVVLAYPRAMIIDETGMKIEPYTRKLPTDSHNPAVRYEALTRFGHSFYEVFGLIRRNALARTPLMGSYARCDCVLLSRLALFDRFQEIPEYLFFPRRHTEQSASMWRDWRRYAVWLNPELTGQALFPYWRMLYEYFRSIKMANLKAHHKHQCYRRLANWIYSHAHLLRGDITFQLRRFLQPLKTKSRANG